LLLSEQFAILFGVSSAACWGAGDFSGGLATKRSNVYRVAIISQVVGLICLVFLSLLLEERVPTLENLLWGVIAGFSGSIGLISLYRGLAQGRMGVVAPISAIVTILVPMIIGFILEGIPKILQLVGFGLALISVYLVSKPEGEAQIPKNELYQAVLAGLGFSFFLIFIDRIDEGVFWPLVSARIASLVLLLIISLFLRQMKMPEMNQIPLISLAGIFDVGGNVFFALAAQAGRLDIAAVLSSLYPAGTVILAWLILKEKMLNWQMLGIILALIAILFITL
jgi:drug/metabolite transporter (DMT)-like permease